MKLWIDDIRKPPDGTWTLARSVTSAIRALYNFSTEIEEISIDHDISHYSNPDNEFDADQDVRACDETFLPVAICIGLMHNNGTYVLQGINWNPKITIHSANPDGAEAIRKVLEEYGLESTVKRYGL